MVHWISISLSHRFNNLPLKRVFSLLPPLILFLLSPLSLCLVLQRMSVCPSVGKARKDTLVWFEGVGGGAWS